MIAALVWPRISSGDPARRLTLSQAVETALNNHPDVRAARANRDAADANLEASRWAELPNAGVSAQLNRSTGNTPPGAFFPQPGFPAVSGAPRGKRLDSDTWQTGASLWASWDVLSLPRQGALVAAARAQRAGADALVREQRLEVAVRAASAFLEVLANQAAVRAAEANVDRARVFRVLVKTLVTQQLRPGVDASRADAEFALAETELVRARQQARIARVDLAEALGIPGQPVEAVEGGVLVDAAARVPATVRAASPDTHPAVQVGRAAVTQAERQQQATTLELLPQVAVVGAIWARGSGLASSPASGLEPDLLNWGAGLTATWPLLDIPRVRARTREATARQREADARYQSTRLAIAGQLQSARARLEGAHEVARQTPVAVSSAREAALQATARYQAGLVSALDVADANRVLARAELDDALARVEVRRAALLAASASGDLSAFLASVGGTWSKE